MTTFNTCNLTGGIDYFPGPFEVRIPAGETSTSFRILIADDEVAENVETFYLSIEDHSLYYLVKVYHYSGVYVYIDDNDCKLKLLYIRSDLQNPKQFCIL